MLAMWTCREMFEIKSKAKSKDKTESTYNRGQVRLTVEKSYYQRNKCMPRANYFCPKFLVGPIYKMRFWLQTRGLRSGILKK